jgi:tRNA (guanine37-N1)-methyltransferase
MRFDIVTIFPAMIETSLREGVLGRAIAKGVIEVGVHDLRAFTDDRHRVVDDVAYGGGPGMVMKPEPFFRAVESIASIHGPLGPVVLTTPDGRQFDHAVAGRLSKARHVTVLCGRYEGVDDRVRSGLATEEISIGDYVLTGGELPALVIVDAVARLVPGVVGDEESVARDSFARGLLDYPQFTRPAEFRGVAVPAVLLSGHHAEIDRWRRREALRRTLMTRPDLLAHAALSDDDRLVLDDLKRGQPRDERSGGGNGPGGPSRGHKENVR